MAQCRGTGKVQDTPLSTLERGEEISAHGSECRPLHSVTGTQVLVLLPLPVQKEFHQHGIFLQH